MPKMSLSRPSLDSTPLSFASVSVGTPDGPLEEKLNAISSAGFQAIELGFPDLLSFAQDFHKKEIKEDDYENLCSAGREVKTLCKKHKLSIMMLQPFSNFEGRAPGSQEREDAFKRARGWIEIMHAVGTDMLQVRPPSLAQNSPLTRKLGRILRLPQHLNRPQYPSLRFTRTRRFTSSPSL
jgi:sugar phosphate isomerase/epimerase